MKKHPSFDESLNLTEALERALKSSALKRGVLATAAATMAANGLAGCAPDAAEGADDLATAEEGGEGKADWAQYEGARNTDMVRYLGESWHKYYDCGSRGGCMAIDVFVKVLVRRVEGANLEDKRVGVVYRGLDGYEQTATGSYFTDRDGLEEWHVRIPRRAYQTDVLLLNAWYQDGKGHTFYDDNAGELHAVAYSGNYSVVQQDWGNTDLTIDETGVHGTIAVVLADLDYDKDVRIVYTTDGWATRNEMRMGSGANQVHWDNDEVWIGHERWSAAVDIPGTFEEFQWAIQYKHGVTATARNYDFWDNNGGTNYHLRR